jgi:hypothetical protein
MGEFHDRHTFIVSSIAEILHPQVVQNAEIDRTDYLKKARLSYRIQTVSPLRKQLALVERDITTETFENIKYDRVPSLAMDRYQGLFLEKDSEHFGDFLSKVATGAANVSGAVLLPSTLVNRARGGGGRSRTKRAGAKVSQIQQLAEQQLLDGQWKTLVKRIKDSGTIESSIAVCDVSGSMGSPRLPDGTCPMDSAIGLSLLLAEIVEPPFGGTFITFSESPQVQKVGGHDDTRTFAQKVEYMMNSEWGMSTDFVAVFEKLILPLAIKNELRQEDMVKQVFVFSDMEFDAASQGQARWSTSFQRIEALFRKAGYEMPTLIFWNLAYGRGYGSWGNDDDDGGRPKPVEADQPGTALVSGYSQAQVKVFLDGGKFDDLEIEEEVEGEEVKDEEANEYEEGGLVDVRVTKKQKVDPMVVVTKAISHPAYQMLKVVD